MSASMRAFGHPKRHPVSLRPPVHALRAWLRLMGQRMRDRRILSELDERDLRDIGISRSQAIYEASKPFWRR